MTDMADITCSSLPYEILKLIAEKLEDIETLKSFRVASPATYAAATPTFVTTAFTRVTCTKADASLARLKRICTSEWIAPHIKYVGFYDWQLTDFPESIPCPDEQLYIPYPPTAVAIEEDCTITDTIPSFEGLKHVNNTAVEVDLVIKSTSPADVPTDGEVPNAENRVRWTRSSHFPSVILEALAISGFVPAKLSLPLDTPLAFWNRSVPIKAYETLAASLREISVRQPTVDYDGPDYPCGMYCYRYIKFNASTLSIAAHILSNAKQLEVLSIRGFTSRFFMPNDRNLFRFFSQKKLRVIRLELFPASSAASLILLIQANASTLELIRLRSVKDCKSRHVLPKFDPIGFPKLREVILEVKGVPGIYHWSYVNGHGRYAPLSGGCTKLIARGAGST